MRHGTTTAYVNGKCRCDKCKLAWSEYHRERKASNPDAVMSHRRYNRIRSRALNELGKRHPDELKEIHQELSKASAL